MTLRTTARGIGLRALLLIIGIVLVGAWMLSLALKIAGAAIHLLLWIGLILIILGVIAFIRRRR